MRANGVMSYSGYESDAAFFDLVALSANPKDRKPLRQVAAAYRALAKKGETRSGSRRDHWDHRAATCRALSEQFEYPACRSQLLRLAETYDLLAATCESDISRAPDLGRVLIDSDRSAIAMSAALPGKREPRVVKGENN